ncbi:MAG: hypothetical protein MUC84_08790, partial [Solirubrobacteraceae bacterium]|nr:hypothetical protein [Solirubrobacteraceae bacterium]
MTATADSVAGEASQGIARPRDPGGTLALALLVLLYVLSAVVITLLGRAQAGPLFSPDEFLYGALAESVAAGEGLSIRGADQEIRAALLVYVLAPAWKAASTVDAYETSKLIGALALSTIVVPVWLAARPYVGQIFALVPAALCVLGAWMVVGGGLMTENLAFPLGTAALVALVAYLRSERLAWGLVFLGLAVAASFGRAQLAVLFPIGALAVLADAGVSWPRWREALRAHRVIGGITGA